MAEYVEVPAEDLATFAAWCQVKGITPSGLPSVDRQASDRQPSDPQKEDRIRAVALAVASSPAHLNYRSNQILAFINGESTTTLQAPLTRLLQACYNVFMAQDMSDHVAVFDRVTDMRDAFGGVLTAMDELGIPRPKGEGAVDQEAGKSDG